MHTRRHMLVALALAFAGAGAQADEALWTLLRGGGQVILMRHAITTPGVGDPPGMKLEDCATQRNLSDEGRADAKAIGDAFRARRVPVGKVFTSPWCRCRETAKLAFGVEAEATVALGNLFGRSEEQGRQLALLRPLAARKPERGNTVMVTHGSTILALAGVSPAPGEMVIVTPQAGGQLVMAGRLDLPKR